MTFHIGDKVRIVNYGHKIWIKGETIRDVMKNAHIIGEEPLGLAVDLRPETVGNEAVICEVSNPQPGYWQYAICQPDGTGFRAWFGHEQLELMEKNNATP